MKFTRHHRIIIAVNVASLLVFAAIFISRQSYEFIGYIIALVIFMALVLVSLQRIRYSIGLLWGLTIWSLLHLSGGGISIAGRKLYTTMLIPFNSEILRYDQVVHAFGFFVATLLVYELVKFSYPVLIQHKIAMGIVIVMAGLGLGALNEIFEFIATVLVPDTSVGGYVNTSLDLVADLLGALLAWVVVLAREKKFPQDSSATIP